MSGSSACVCTLPDWKGFGVLMNRIQKQILFEACAKNLNTPLYRKPFTLLLHRSRAPSMPNIEDFRAWQRFACEKFTSNIQHPHNLDLQAHPLGKGIVKRSTSDAGHKAFAGVALSRNYCQALDFGGFSFLKTRNKSRKITEQQLLKAMKSHKSCNKRLS